MNNEDREKLRVHINHILKNAEYGRFKNSCSGCKDCHNITNYKLEHIKDYFYYCSEYANIKRTELPI